MFIDGAYIYREYIRPFGRVNYPALRQAVADTVGGEVTESFFFNATDQNASDQIKGLHEALRKWHFKVYEGWLQSRPLSWPDGAPVLHPITLEPYVLQTQKGVDVSMGYNLLRSFIAHRWSDLALVSGDADFEEPVRDLVENCKVRLHLFGIYGTISTRLQHYASSMHLLNEEPLRTKVAFQSDNLKAGISRSK